MNKLIQSLFLMCIAIFISNISFANDFTPKQDEEFMKEAIKEAEKGYAVGGIPIGSVLVYEGKIISRGHNQRVQNSSAIHHGEMNCLENVGRLPAHVYQNSVLYTTLSPCPMCSGAIRLYKIPRVVIGENKTFMGDEKVLKRAGVKLSVLNDKKCVELMDNFIKKHPEIWNEDIGVHGKAVANAKTSKFASR